MESGSHCLPAFAYYTCHNVLTVRPRGHKLQNFLSLKAECIPLCVYTPHCLRLLLHVGHVSCVCFLAVGNSAAVNRTC